MTTSLTPTPPAPAHTARRVVRELLQFEVLDAATPPADRDPIEVRGLLRWTSTDPHTVAVVFHPGARAEVTWLISRDLLADGVHGPAGLGDMSILPDLHSGTHRELVLSSPSGRRGLRFPVAPLVAFLDRTRENSGCPMSGNDGSWTSYGPCVCLCQDCVNGRGHCGGLDCGQSGKWFAAEVTSERQLTGPGAGPMSGKHACQLPPGGRPGCDKALWCCPVCWRRWVWTPNRGWR